MTGESSRAKDSARELKVRKKVPASSEAPRITTDLLRVQAAARPETTAIRVDGGAELSFSELERRSNRLGRGLAARGIEAGDRIACYATNEDACDFMVAHFAIHKAGAVAVPLNTRMAPNELSQVATDTNSKLVLVTAGLARSPSLRILEASTPLGVAVATGRVREAGGWPQLENGDTVPFQVEIGGDSLADILPTSGTTGRPKYVGTTHSDIMTLTRSPLPFGGEVYLHAIPLFTFTGAQAMTFLPLASGMTQLVQAPFDPERFLELIGEATATFLVPAMAVLMAKHEAFANLKAPKLHLVFLGTAPTPPWAIRAWAEKVPSATLVNLYGLTEGGGAVCAIAGSELLEHPTAAGRPVPPAECKVVDDLGNECAPGEMGEILLRQPGVRRSYVGETEDGAGTFDTEGWVHTGDLGTWDPSGLLYVVDRKKDLIIRGGFNIASAEVENAILEHPSVLEAAVVGVPHEVLGEDVVAFIVRRPGAMVSESELREHLLGLLADYKVPRRILFVSSLARNPTGKVLKSVLREEALGRSEVEPSKAHD
ncbi:MAG: acyl--CoA ligase [Actinobacteria bacterium]|nr:acyl--CoA ligase [Actinomycetota bacterium]